MFTSTSEEVLFLYPKLNNTEDYYVSRNNKDKQAGNDSRKQS